MSFFLLLVFLFLLLVVFLNFLKSNTSTTKNNANEVIDAVYSMLEQYGTDVIKMYDDNIIEVKNLIENGEKEKAEIKIKEFKNNVRVSLVSAKKDCEIFKQGNK